MVVGRTCHAFLTVPNRSSQGAELALLGCWVVVGEVGGTGAGESSFIPNVRGLAGDALAGIRVEVRVLSIALAFGKSSVEGKARRTTLAFLGVVVPVIILGAALAFLSR